MPGFSHGPIGQVITKVSFKYTNMFNQSLWTLMFKGIHSVQLWWSQDCHSKIPMPGIHSVQSWWSWSLCSNLKDADVFNWRSFIQILFFLFILSMITKSLFKLEGCWYVWSKILRSNSFPSVLSMITKSSFELEGCWYVQLKILCSNSFLSVHSVRSAHSDNHNGLLLPKPTVICTGHTGILLHQT